MLKLEVCRSNAGYYIGISEDGVPFDRCSGYYKERKSVPELPTRATSVIVPDTHYIVTSSGRCLKSN